MNIGIDFDNTLVDTAKSAKKYLDIYKPGNNLKSYHDLPLDEEIYFFNRYRKEMSESLEFIEGAKDAISFFKSKGIKIFLVTARNFEAQTAIYAKDFLEKNGIIFDKLCFNNSLKGDACKENHIDLMIDDTDYVIKELQEKNIRTLKFGSKSDTSDYALNWEEVTLYVERMLNENIKC